MTEQDTWAKHLDHELSQLLFLHAEFRAKRFREYPEEVQRACDVAYAAHLRVVLEFRHCWPAVAERQGAGGLRATGRCTSCRFLSAARFVYSEVDNS